MPDPALGRCVLLLLATALATQELVRGFVALHNQRAREARGALLAKFLRCLQLLEEYKWADEGVWRGDLLKPFGEVPARWQPDRSAIAPDAAAPQDGEEVACFAIMPEVLFSLVKKKVQQRAVAGARRAGSRAPRRQPCSCVAQATPMSCSTSTEPC